MFVSYNTYRELSYKAVCLPKVSELTRALAAVTKIFRVQLVKGT
jgi:hypothetical protein